MTRLDIALEKHDVAFRGGELQASPPEDPAFVLVLGGLEIRGKVNAKAAKKLAAHRGGTVLQGKLGVEGGEASLAEAGFSWIKPRAEEAEGGAK